MTDRIFIEPYVGADIDEMTDCDLDFIILHVSWHGSYQGGISYGTLKKQHLFPF